MSDLKTSLHLEIAHVLFIDVVSYSKLSVNEQSELLQKLNHLVLATGQVRAADAANQLIRLPTGDGMALVFRNHPEAAVECALEIATALKRHPDIPVRMGVHSGPVTEIVDVNQRANIAGAGVNMAQRVMDCGDAGHILVSKRVADDLAQYRQWQPLLHVLGEVEVKHGVKLVVVNLYRDDAGNPSTPEKIRRAWRAKRRRRGMAVGVGVLVVLTIGALIWISRHRSEIPSVTTTAEIPVSSKSIAVLPLENLSDDKENAFFADGIQDDLLTSLAKIKDLKVISRTSVMSYRDKSARNLKQIGRELGVANLLEGSVRRVGGRVVVNVQLIDATKDLHLWAERYDRTLADSITLQGELAAEIANALRATLSPEEKARVEQKPTDDPEAYVAYLRGREVQLRPETSRENYLSAIDFYQQAVARDPKFVLARARLSYMQAILFEYFESSNEARLTEARANADEALKLDIHSAEAHLASAQCARLAHDVARAKDDISAALRLNPNDASIFMAAAMTQHQIGLLDEAVASYKRAAELGPREPKVFYNYGVLLFGMRRENESRAALDRALELAPESVFFRLFRTRAEIAWSGDIAQAKKILAGLPAGRDPDGRVTAVRCSLALFERDFPATLRLVDTFPGEQLSCVGYMGWGAQIPKEYNKGLVWLYSGDRVRANECFDTVRWKYEVDVRDHPESARAHGDLGELYAYMGWKEAARAELTRTVEIEKAAALPPEKQQNLALAYVWLGEPDLAWPYIESRSVPPYYFYRNEMRLNPAYDPCRQDPRFQKLMAESKP